jgi:hypothetical protein
MWRRPTHPSPRARAAGRDHAADNGGELDWSGRDEAEKVLRTDAPGISVQAFARVGRRFVRSEISIDTAQPARCPSSYLLMPL